MPTPAGQWPSARHSDWRRSPALVGGSSGTTSRGHCPLTPASRVGPLRGGGRSLSRPPLWLVLEPGTCCARAGAGPGRAAARFPGWRPGARRPGSAPRCAGVAPVCVPGGDGGRAAPRRVTDPPRVPRAGSAAFTALASQLQSRSLTIRLPPNGLGRGHSGLSFTQHPADRGARIACTFRSPCSLSAVLPPAVLVSPVNQATQLPIISVLEILHGPDHIDAVVVIATDLKNKQTVNEISSSSMPCASSCELSPACAFLRNTQIWADAVASHRSFQPAPSASLRPTVGSVIR